MTPDDDLRDLRDLRLLHRAAAAANRSASLEEAVAEVLEAVYERTGWPAGHLHVVPSGAAAPAAAPAGANGRGGHDLLAPSSTWFLADPSHLAGFRAALEATPPRPGEGLAARAAASGAPVWVADVARHGDLPVAPAAVEHGLRAGFAFPVVLDGAAVAVLEFFATSEAAPSEGLLEVLASVGDDLARLAARARDREELERHLAQRTLQDPLTGLPNRTLLRDRLGHAIARASRLGTGVAVMSVDLDRFKDVNAAYGHHAGDDLLVAAAARLQETLRPDDTVARVGGDEFAAVCEDVGDATAAQVMAQRVGDALARPFLLGEDEVALSASVGVAVGRAEGGATEGGVGPAADRLLRDAEMAREQARERGHGQSALYEESMRSDVAERLAVEQGLRAALRDGHLRLHYQPIVDLGTGAVAGVEALVRWQHPIRGLLAPQDFIRVAEDSGLIVPVGQWVLEEACRQGMAWQRALAAGPAAGGRRLRVSVNVSARQFQQPRWADDVADALLITGFPPEELVLEITESVLMTDTDITAARLAELRALGVRVAIDDFGTGYSSLGYLRRFPVDILKVDKSFIDGVAEGPHESALARAVIKLAATLHLDAVAEGIGNRRQLAALRRLRCRFGQGFYFSKPQAAATITALLARPPAGLDPTAEAPELGILEAPATRP